MRIAPMIVTAMSVQSNLPPPCTSFISSATAINETAWIAIRGIAMIAPKATRSISERNATARAASASPIRWSHLLDSLRKLIIFFMEIVFVWDYGCNFAVHILMCRDRVLCRVPPPGHRWMSHFLFNFFQCVIVFNVKENPSFTLSACFS